MIDKSKRIVKNTFFLYLRMLFVMFITLFTSRVILDKLGIEDFGINNAVGGLAMMFTFFSSSLANVTQRFLNIELGKNNTDGAKRVFNQHILIYCIIILVAILLAETIGLWLVTQKLVIPLERMDAALWVYQFTVLSLCITLIGVVFNSVIIAHENMKIYSYVGIIEGIIKLAIAYIISVVPADRLISYSFLLLLSVICIQGFYAIYCFKHYTECKLQFTWSKSTLKETFSFISWNFLGTIIYATKDIGGNLILNIFFGPTVNAARAISYQINTAIISLGTNFFTSVRPQIVKSYASKDYEYLNKLFLNSTKYSLLLLWFLILPVALCINTILSTWLKTVPEYCNVFTVWILLDSLLAILINPTWSVVLAIGELKKYTLLGNGILLLILPTAYIFYLLGYDPVSIFIITFFIRILQVIIVLIITNSYIHFSIKQYLRKVIFPIIYVFSFSGVISYSVKTSLKDSFSSLIILSIISTISISISIWLFGINTQEKQFVISYIKKKIKSKQ